MGAGCSDESSAPAVHRPASPKTRRPTRSVRYLQRSVEPLATKLQLGAVGAGPGKNISQHWPLSAIGGSAMNVTFTGSLPIAIGYEPPLPTALNFVMPTFDFITNFNFLMPLMSGTTVPAF